MKNILAFLIVVFLVSACKDDPQPEVTLVDDPNVILSYQCTGNEMSIKIDAIGDTTNQLDQTNEFFDYFLIYVDFNQNGVVDFNEDFVLSLIENEMACRSIMLEANVVSPCEFSTDWNGNSTFGTSLNRVEDHVMHEFNIQKDILSNGNQANVIIHALDLNRGWSYFPQQDIDFTSTLQLNW